MNAAMYTEILLDKISHVRNIDYGLVPTRTHFKRQIILHSKADLDVPYCFIKKYSDVAICAAILTDIVSYVRWIDFNLAPTLNQVTETVNGMWAKYSS